jgi:hypothetical protein
VRGRRRLVSATLAGGCAVLLASGCGSGSGGSSAGSSGTTESETTQKTDTAAQAPHAHTYKIEVLDLTFKPEQQVGRPAKMRIVARNADTQTLPDVAVTLDAFYYSEKHPDLPASKRPVWVVARGPGSPPQPPAKSRVVSPQGGGQTAYVNTWALGPLAVGHQRVFEWTVIPVKAGVQHVSLQISAGLGGQIKTTLPNGGALEARFRSEIAAAPPTLHVNPSTGEVVRG